MITARKLKALGACQEQVDKFKALFPRGAECTEALCLEHAQIFNWSWAARNLLSSAASTEYDRVRAATFAKLYLKENHKAECAL